jgi:hypothetical protein
MEGRPYRGDPRQFRPDENDPRNYPGRGVRDYVPGSDEFDEDFSQPEDHFFDDDFDEYNDDDDYDDDFEDGFYDEDEDEWRYEEYEPRRHEAHRRSRQARISHGIPGRYRLVRRHVRHHHYPPAMPYRYRFQPEHRPPRFDLASHHVNYPGIVRRRQPSEYRSYRQRDY